MKKKATRKYIKDNFTLLNAGCCNLQNILRPINPSYYVTRVEGWAFDAYIFDGIAIMDGYDCIGSMKPGHYEIFKKYDDVAREIYNDYSCDYETREKRVIALLRDMLGDLKVK